MFDPRHCFDVCLQAFFGQLVDWFSGYRGRRIWIAAPTAPTPTRITAKNHHIHQVKRHDRGELDIVHPVPRPPRVNQVPRVASGKQPEAPGERPATPAAGKVKDQDQADRHTQGVNYRWVCGGFNVPEVGQVEVRFDDRDPGGRTEVGLEHLVKNKEGHGG